jgi:hypothetical protein
MTDGSRRRLLLPSVALLLALASGTARAYTDYEIQSTVPHYRQAKSNWCWAAVGLMMVKHFRPNDPSTQSSLVQSVKGSTDNVTGSSGDILNGAGIWFDYVAAPISGGAIKENIDRNRPIEATIRYNSGTKHAVVLYGYHLVNAQYNGVFEVIYWDPASGTTTRTTYEDFVQNGNGAWWETRYNLRDPAVIYSDANNGGQIGKLDPGCYDWWQLLIGNDTLSSVYVPQAQSVQLFWDGGFSGGNVLFTASQSYVGDAWNDQTSGVCVYERPYACGMRPGQALLAGQTLMSCDAQRMLVMQGDGNLVLYNSSYQPLWHACTNGTSGNVAVMQADGNLVVYDANHWPVWSSGTWNNPGASLSLDDATVRATNGAVLWSASTACR